MTFSLLEIIANIFLRKCENEREIVSRDCNLIFLNNYLYSFLPSFFVETDVVVLDNYCILIRILYIFKIIVKRKYNTIISLTFPEFQQIKSSNTIYITRFIDAQKTVRLNRMPLFIQNILGASRLLRP